MATSTKKAAQKTATTKKAAFAIAGKKPAAPKKAAKPKVKHHIPATLRPIIMKIGKEIDRYISLLPDLLTRPLLYGSYAGFAGGLYPSRDADKLKDNIGGLGYYLSHIIHIIGKYDYNNGFPAITKADADNLIDFVNDGFNCCDYSTWTDHRQALNVFRNMALTATILTDVKEDYGCGLNDLTDSLTRCNNIDLLASEAYKLNELSRQKVTAERDKRKATELAARTLIVDYGRHIESVPEDIAVELCVQIVHHYLLNPTTTVINDANTRNAVRVVANDPNELHMLQERVDALFNEFIKYASEVSTLDIPKMAAYYRGFVKKYSLYPRQQIKDMVAAKG